MLPELHTANTRLNIHTASRSRGKAVKQKLSLLAIFVATLVITTFSSTANAYNPPVGIPDPGFGIDDVRPDRPDPWTSEEAGYYYINYQTGSDSNSYGTPSSPRRTIPSTIPAGSYVEVHGTYDYTTGGVTKIKGDGNSSSWVADTSGPVWVVGQDSSNIPFFTRKVLVFGSYVYFDTIRIYDTGIFQVGSSSAGYPADHIVLRNSEASGNLSSSNSGLLRIGGASSDPVSYVIAYNITIHDHGDVNANSDQDAHATTVGNYSSYVWFLKNTIYNASGSGAQVGGAYGGGDNCHHIYYGKNTVYNTRQAGLAVKYASDVIFSQNILHDIVDMRVATTSFQSPSKGVGFQYAPQRVWILFNTIYNNSFGIYAGSTNSGTDWYVYAVGNLIYNIHLPASLTYSSSTWAEAGIMMAGGTYRYIVNNTIYNVDAGINAPSNGTYYYLENNVISNITEASGHHILMESGTSATNSTFDNNILYQNGDDVRIKWGTGTVYSLSGFKNKFGKCQNCSSSNPQFEAPSTGGFKLEKSSPAVDTGVLHQVYATFLERYGIDISKDIEGKPRPMGKGKKWDIGAYERVVPAAPAGVQ